MDKRNNEIIIAFYEIFQMISCIAKNNWKEKEKFRYFYLLQQLLPVIRKKKQVQNGLKVKEKCKVDFLGLKYDLH